jgi:hypothetical protein
VLELLKKGPASVFIPKVRPDTARRNEFSRIRCPLCRWQPSASSLWACESFGTPEPYFGGCGAMWNTFETHGECPGCSHRWVWTSCHRCHGWSLHEDWYDRFSDDE